MTEKKEDINPRNHKGYHGYQEWYNLGNNKLWYRANRKYGLTFGYSELNQVGLRGIGEDGTEVRFNIR